MDKYNNAWLSDFGIAKMNGTGDQELTSIDMIMGTLNYMSPEQRDNTQEVDQRSDIYALGIILYEIATGKRPEGIFKEPRKINPEISTIFEGVILKCIEQQKDKRYQNVDDLNENLLKSLKGTHIESRSKDKVYEGLVKMQETFQLLDIIKQDEFSGVYLFNHKVKQQMMVIKSFPLDRKGIKVARNLQELNHPHVIKILGVGENPKQFIVVMEYIEGGNLQDRMIKEYQWKEIMAMGRQVASGLSYAHKKDIIHGNIRPSNILFNKKNVPIVTDFTLKSHYKNGVDKVNWYASPEPVISLQADIFALGVILYQLISNRLPKRDKKTGQLNLDNMKGRAPNAVQKVIKKMLEKSRSLRYQSFDEVINDIKNIERGMAIIARRKAEMKMQAKRRKKRLVVLGSLGLVAIIIYMGCIFYTD